MLSGEGRLPIPLTSRDDVVEDEFCLEREIELLNGDGDEGVEGVDGVFDDKPRSFLALRITE